MNKKGPKIDNYRKMRKKGNFHIFQKEPKMIQKREVYKDDKKRSKIQLIFTKKEESRSKKIEKREKKRKRSTQTSLTLQISKCQNIHVMLSYAKKATKCRYKTKKGAIFICFYTRFKVLYRRNHF